MDHIIFLKAADFVAINKNVVTIYITTTIIAGVVVFLKGYFHFSSIFRILSKSSANSAALSIDHPSVRKTKNP